MSSRHEARKAEDVGGPRLEVRGGNFGLMMCLDRWAYRAKHIPGSLRLGTGCFTAPLAARR
jgi:hypothetical protein